MEASRKGEIILLLVGGITVIVCSVSTQQLGSIISQGSLLILQMKTQTNGEVQ